MSAIIALLLLAVIKLYLIELPFMHKAKGFKSDFVERLYFSNVRKLLLWANDLLPELKVMLVVLPLTLGILLLKLLFSLSAGIVGEVLFSFAILYYCFGNFDRLGVAEETKETFVAAHEQMFALLFWFLALGPVGVVFYWLLTNMDWLATADADDDTEVEYDIATDETFNSRMDILHRIAAWIPARITGFIYALVGNFILGYKSWLKGMRVFKMPSSKFLVICGFAALGDASKDNVTSAAKNDAIKNLLLRTFITWILLIITVELILI